MDMHTSLSLCPPSPLSGLFISSLYINVAYIWGHTANALVQAQQHTHCTHTDTLVYINAKQKQATHTQAHTHTHVWPGLSCRANAAKFMILFHACFSLTFSFVADPPCSILPCAAKNYNFFFWLLCYSPVALPPAARPSRSLCSAAC